MAGSAVRTPDFHSCADDSVDLALGTDFTTLAHNDSTDAVLAGAGRAPSDPALLAKIHANSCDRPVSRDRL